MNLFDLFFHCSPSAQSRHRITRLLCIDDVSCGMPKFPWPSPLIAYAWDIASQTFHLHACYEYILVKEATSSISVASMHAMRDLNSAAEAKLLSCPFLVLHKGDCTTAISASGQEAPFAYEDHPVTQAKIHMEESWVLSNACATVTTYKMQPTGFEFIFSEVILSSTMCLPQVMAADEVAFLAKCRRGHIEKQVANCRVLLQNFNVLSVYSAKTFEHLKTL